VRLYAKKSNVLQAQIKGGAIPKHIRHNEESHMRPPNVNLVEMADSPIARSDSDIFELNVHIIFGCSTHKISFDSIFTILGGQMSQVFDYAVVTCTYLREACHDRLGQT
jgi:hypothetical protein